MTIKKEETPQRKARRKYEEVNKEYREQATKQFNTRLPCDLREEIEDFLEKHKITKVELIRAGYKALQSKYGPKKTE